MFFSGTLRVTGCVRADERTRGSVNACIGCFSFIFSTLSYLKLSFLFMTAYDRCYNIKDIFLSLRDFCLINNDDIADGSFYHPCLSVQCVSDIVAHTRLQHSII